MTTALIGHTGFVGGNLLAQRAYDAVFNSTSIAQIDGRHFTSVRCAGVTAVKWWANQNAEEDLGRIQALMAHLETITCDTFTLISTVDVYSDSMGKTEDDQPDLAGLHPYGRHRAMLESWISARFPHSIIVRLPALFGPGLKKNAIYDLMHGNRLNFIHPESSFQWYPLLRLSEDLASAEGAELRVLNLSVEPVAMSAIAGRFFPGNALGGDVAAPAFYDMRSRHAALFGGKGGYAVTADAMMAELGRFLQPEAS